MQSKPQPDQSDETERHPLALGVWLGFVAGYVDTVGFIALFGLFAAHITGNFVLLSAEMAMPEHSFPLLKMLAFPAFVIGVVLARMIASLCDKRAWDTLRVLCTVEVVLLTAFMLTGLITFPLKSSVSPAAILTGCTAAVAMGVHGACGRLRLPELAPTTVMTGNVTQCVIEFINFLQNPGGENAWNRCAKYLWPIISFGVGAFMAAFAYLRLGFWALVLPILIILVIAYAGDSVRSRK